VAIIAFLISHLIFFKMYTIEVNVLAIKTVIIKMLFVHFFVKRTIGSRKNLNLNPESIA